MDTKLIAQASQLSMQEQLELVDALWDNISKSNFFTPTQVQKAELDRRLAELDANPEDVVAWSDVKAEALSHIGR